MAGYWHDDYPEVREIHHTRRETADERNSSMQVTLEVPIASLYDFIQAVMRDRFCVENSCGILLCPQRIDAIHTSGRYSTTAEEDVIVPDDFYHVIITYASDPRMGITLFGQEVLVLEKLTIATELLTQDYTQFAWQTTPTVSLTSPDMAPSKIYRFPRIEMTIDRLDINVAPSGTGSYGGLSPIEILGLISSTCNDNSASYLSFWTFPTLTYGPEQIMAEVTDVTPTIEIWNGLGYDDWWTVRLTFSIRPQGWNKFWRYKKAGTQDDSDWEQIVHIATADNSNQPEIESIYTPGPYIGYFLNPS